MYCTIKFVVDNFWNTKRNILNEHRFLLCIELCGPALFRSTGLALEITLTNWQLDNIQFSTLIPRRIQKCLYICQTCSNVSSPILRHHANKIQIKATITWVNSTHCAHNSKRCRATHEIWSLALHATLPCILSRYWHKAPNSPSADYHPYLQIRIDRATAELGSMQRNAYLLLQHRQI